MKSDQNKEPGINEVLRDHHHNHQHQKHHSLHHHHHHHHSFTHQHLHHYHHQDSVSYDVICDEEVSSLLSKIPNFVAKDIEYTGSESIVAEISTVIDQAPPPPPPPILVRHLGSRDTLRGGGWPVELKTERPILDFRKMRKRKFQRDGKESKQSLNFLCRLLCRHSLADFNGGNFKPITVIPLKELPFHQTHRHRCRSSIAVAQKCQPSVHLESMVRGGEPLKELATASETEPLRPCAAVKFANKWTFKEGSGIQNDQSVKKTTSTGDKSDSDADGSILTKFLKTSESEGRATENSFRNTDNNNKNSSFIDNSNNNNRNNNNNNIINNTNNNCLLTFDKIVQEVIASKPTSCQTFHSISNQSWGGVFFPNEAPPPFLPIGSN